MGRNKVKIVVLPLVFLFVLFALFFLIPVNKCKARGVNEWSRRIYDRNSILLREIPSSEYFVSSWTPIDSIPEYVLKCFVQKEDKRFYSHFGIDILSMARALRQNIKNRRIISGASTITMQTARIIYSLQQPKLIRKILEILYSIKLEIHLTKREILEIYLNRTHFGNNIYGIASTSETYFSKSAASLSLKEASMLAVTLQAPSVYNPIVNRRSSEMADALLKEMASDNIISSEEYGRAVKEKAEANKEKLKFRLPHLCDRVIFELKDKKWIKAFTSADCALQEELEEIIKTSLDPLEDMNVTNGSIMITDSRTGDVLVMIGSKEYFSDNIDGQYNACYGMRSPGSSLKPFTYSLGLLNGYNASSIIMDEPTYFKEVWGDFKPENYDFKFHGPVTLRQALGCSYNVPACKVLDSIGVDKLYGILKKMNFDMHSKGPNDYGVALTLGSMSVSLFELVSGYSVFANKGCQTSPQIIDSYMLENGKIIRMKKEKEKRIFPEWTAFLMGDILSDNNARIPAFDMENPFKFKFYVGAKTGTSKNYKDNFAVGFTDRYIIGVWVGNNDESPMVGVSGMTGAGPLFRNAVMTLSKYYNIGDYPSTPDSILKTEVCSKSGKSVSNKCREKYIDWIHISEISEKCTICGNETKKIQRIKYPDNGDVFVIDRDFDLKRQMFEVIIDGDKKDMTLMIDGNVVKERGEDKKIFFNLKTGKHTIELYSDTLLIDKVIFLVQ
jgi:penicillin-binding protein 1C